MPTKVVPHFCLTPPSLTTRTYWAGLYTEMTGTVVMLFEKRPEPDAAGEFNVLNDAYVASIWIWDWEAWFGTVQPFIDAGVLQRAPSINCGYVAPELECRKVERVIEIEVTMPHDADGAPFGLDVRADN